MTARISTRPHIGQALSRNLQQSPDSIATSFGNRNRTVAEQTGRVSRLAGVLRGHGVHIGDRVAILALNSDDYLESVLAVWWAGAVATPINTRWNAREDIYALTDSGSTVLIVDDTFADLVPELRAACPNLKVVIPFGDDYTAMIAAARPAEERRRGGNQPAGIFYTGGTTGVAKGVVISHEGLIASAIGSQATYPSMTPGGNLLLVAPLFHLAALFAWIGQTVVGGSSTILSAFDPASTLDAIEFSQVTTALLVPTMIQMIVDHPSIVGRNLDSLRVVLYGASPISSSLLERAMAAIPHAQFVQAYGMTELSPVATLLGPAEHLDKTLRRSAGRAAAHSEVIVGNTEGRELPRGEIGEVLVRGPHLMLRYWNKPHETEEALRSGWMHTGDAGYMDDAGYVFVVDRMKDMIISGGENIYSSEVENAVGTHPAVAASAVIGVPDPTWGERVHAVVTLKPGMFVTSDQLIDHVRNQIAGYKVPRTVEFVDALPHSAAGKVLKRQLRAPYWEGADRDVG